MTQPWPEELIEKIGLVNILSIRKMHRSDCLAWLDANEDLALSDEERELVLNATKPDKQFIAPTEVVSSPYMSRLNVYRERAIFCAAAWLAGASWGQLALMYEVSRQSIMSSASKYLPVNRADARIAVNLPSLETVSAWREWYSSIDSAKYSVVELATRFLTIIDD